MTWLVLLNEAAGSKPMPARRVEAALGAAGVEHELRLPTSAVEMAREVVAGAEAGRPVAVVGGDGTVNLAVDALMQRSWQEPPKLAVLPAGTGSMVTPGGETGVWMMRPGCSRLPWTQVMSSGATPWSSSSIARIHTAVVIWYSGTPTRLPLRSSGRVIDDRLLTYSVSWRNDRDRKTGTPTKSVSPRSWRMT